MEWQAWKRWAAGVAVALVGVGSLILGYRRDAWEPVPASAAPLSDLPAASLATGGGANGATGGEKEAAPGGADAGEKPAASGPRPEAATIVVHVSGAVAAPGVYRLAAGARVQDAVDAARPLAGAMPHALNLAAPLRDGEKIYVPTAEDLKGAPSELPPAALGADHGPGDAAGGGCGTGSGRVDLNRASAEELTAVPGIGPELARRIVAHRESAGRFKQVDDLLAVPGIGPARLAQIREYVEVR